VPKIDLVVGRDPHALLEQAAEGFLVPPTPTADEPFASPRHLLALRQGGLRDDLIALAAGRGVRGWFDPPLCIFGELPGWLGATPRKACGEFERTALLAEVLRHTAHGVFGSARRIDDFLAAVDRLFGDLAAEDITPDAYEAALAGLAGRDDFERRRDDELARAYRLYVDELARAGMRDGRDALADCARAIDATGVVGEALRGRREIRVFGLADLRGGWRPLLRALDGCPGLDRIVIYSADHLPVDAGLLRGVSELPGTSATVGAFELVEALDHEAEAERVAARVRVLVDRGVPAGRIAIVAREARPNVDLAVRALGRFGVPATARLRHPLRSIPVVRALLALFGAAAEGWMRHGLVELAEQPYFANDLDARVMNFIGYRRRVVGLDEWGAALTALEVESRRFEAGEDVEDDHRRAPPPSWRVAKARAAFLTFAERVRLLDAARPLAAWLDWLAEFLGSDPWHIGERIYRVSDERFSIARLDLAAYRGLAAIVREWQGAVRHWAPPVAALDVAAFLARLSTMLDGDQPLWTETGQGVQVLEAFAAAYRSFEHLFLVGMEAGRWPIPAPGSPLLDEGQRDALHRAGMPFDVRADWDLRERRLFDVLVAGAHGSLTVSCATGGSGREAAIPSVLVEEVGEALRRSEAPPYCSVDALPRAPAYRSREVAEHARRAAEIERVRETGARSPYNGLVEDPGLVAALAEEFGDARLWSPTQLESYAKCPWAYFSSRLLHLEKLEDPDDDIDPAVRGRVLHDALARFYDGAVARVGGPVFLRDADRTWVGPLLMGALDDAIARAREVLWIGAPALFEAKRAELRRLLTRYLDFEIGANEDSFAPRKRTRPKMLRTAVAEHEVEFTDVVLERGGVAFRFRGRIDRVEVGADERVPSGAFLAAVDYKTSRYAAPGGGDAKAWSDGVVLQVPLYAYALTRLRPGSRVARVEYRAIKQREEVHSLQLVHVDRKAGALVEDEEAARLMESALDAVAEHVMAVRGGIFPAAPPESCGCPSFCHAWEICRVKGSPRTKEWRR
jgi:hypothetical protein